MVSKTQHLHLLLIPLMSQSHLIPFMDMATLLAQRAITVTIILTPLNATRFQTFINNARKSNLKIHIVVLKFPSQEAGLPQGCENMDSLPSPDLASNFFKASSMMQEPLEAFIYESKTRPNCIVSDMCFPWTADIALKFNIPRIVFKGISSFTCLCSHNLNLYKVCESVTSESEPFLVPNMPDRIEFTKAQLPATTTLVKNNPRLFEQMNASEVSAIGVVINSFDELESEYIKGYRNELVANKVWCIGPVSLCNKEVPNSSSNDKHPCLKWLDLMKPRSVIYVCFGSLCHLNHAQMIEIGLGLHASNHPFIWVIRESDYSKEFDKEGIVEKIKKTSRGLVIRGWAPQVSILSHGAVGGFMTHCGWNSTLEGVSAGVPMITWPMSAEQFYNEKLVVQVLKIGVRVGVESYGEVVKREQVMKSVEELMGEKQEERRERARELGEMAHRAIQQGGSSYFNITLLIQHILDQLQCIQTS